MIMTKGRDKSEQNGTAFSSESIPGPEFWNLNKKKFWMGLCWSVHEEVHWSLFVLLCIHCITLPVDGGYGRWSGFTVCSKSCGEGFQIRERMCNNPKPQGGGKDCSVIGSDTITRSCNSNPCPRKSLVIRLIMLRLIKVLLPSLDGNGSF